MSDLSVLIPARMERWLPNTVADVCAKKRGDTHVIVVLDGAWPDHGLPQHPDVEIVYLPTAIGQRAATNLAARISTARYVLKLDAHCSVADGFDKQLIADAQSLEREVLQVPAQKHLHVFDQVCPACQLRRDQSPVLKACPTCNCPLTQEVVWQPRTSPTTTAWRFDSDLHFNYWSGARGAQRGQEFPEVMSCLGACWFLDREWFLSLGGLDEDHGSWGQMGTELACKAWLSGGRMVVNKATWFAHFFRVGGHGFPYPISAAEQDYARTYSKNLWRGNHWPGQVRPLRWLVDKFWPVPGWSEEARDALPKALDNGAASLPTIGVTQSQLVPVSGVISPNRTGRADYSTAGVVYYSHAKGDPAILTACYEQLYRAAGTLDVACVVLHQTPAFVQGAHIVLMEHPGILTMFKQILAGLEALDTEVAFLAEHDVIYSPEHFTFRPPNATTYFYNLAWWKVDAVTGQAITYRAKQTSQLCANRELLIAHYRKRIAIVEAQGFSRSMGFEPGSHRRTARVDDVPSDVWRSNVPNIDIRHGANLTPSRWRQDEFRDQRNCQDWQEADAVPGWGPTRGRMAAFLADLTHAKLTCDVA